MMISCMLIQCHQDKIPQIAQLISRLSKFFLTVDNPVILDALESYELTNGKKFSILTHGGYWLW